MAFRYLVGLVIPLILSIPAWADDLAGHHKKTTRHSSSMLIEEKLKPSVRKTPLAEEIKVIPTDAISQFLTSPKVLDKDELNESPYIIDFPSEHLVVGAGDRIYVRSILQPETLNYTVYRKGQPYLNPETKEVLGYEAIYIASALLEKEGDPATLTVTKSNQELRLGDRLMPSSEKDTVVDYMPKVPEFELTGNIINVLDGVSEIGQHNIIVIDKGLSDGLKVGDLLTIYHRGAIIRDSFKIKDKAVAVKLPNETAGLVMIFRPFERVSYGLVMQATQAIHVLDKVKTH
jgi:hypothetical protein